MMHFHINKRKISIVVFNGEPIFFAHALLNVLDMAEKGIDIKLIIEGSATRQVKELQNKSEPFAPLYEKVKATRLIDCVCKACSAKFGALQSAEERCLRLCSEMSGHPSMGRYLQNGYEVIAI